MVHLVPRFSSLHATSTHIVIWMLRTTPPICPCITILTKHALIRFVSLSLVFPTLRHACPTHSPAFCHHRVCAPCVRLLTLWNHHHYHLNNINPPFNLAEDYMLFGCLQDSRRRKRGKFEPTIRPASSSINWRAQGGSRWLFHVLHCWERSISKWNLLIQNSTRWRL